MTSFVFVIPDPSDFISGGNSYNRQLLQAILEVGGSVSQMTYEQFKAEPVNQAQYIFDTIYFQNIRNDRTIIPDGSMALIHHLQSLFPVSAKTFEEVDRPILQKFSAFIATSQYTKNYLQSNGIDNPIVVIEPALNTTNDRATPHVGKVNAIMVNNIIPRKGLFPFLEAIALEKIPPYYRITIVGDMKSDEIYSKECVNIVRRDTLLNRTVQFSGKQDDITVARLYSKSNLFISGSYMETFGMSIQEASNHGLPLLVLDGGNTSNHVVPGINGWVESAMIKLAKRFAYILSHSNELIEIQQNAHHYRHPYLQTYRDGAELFLEFTEDL